MHITAGQLKGRKLLSPQDRRIRPSASRTREAMFDLLLHAPAPEGLSSAIAGQRVVDICCRSGLLGLEAISRGAERVLFVDHHRESLELARANCETLNVERNAEFLQADAARLPSARLPFSVIVADPPYDSDLAPALLAGITGGNWLIQGGYIALELPSKAPVPESDTLELYRERTYGKARLVVYRLASPLL